MFQHSLRRRFWRHRLRTASSCLCAPSPRASLCPSRALLRRCTRCLGPLFLLVVLSCGPVRALPATPPVSGQSLPDKKNFRLFWVLYSGPLLSETQLYDSGRSSLTLYNEHTPCTQSAGTPAGTPLPATTPPPPPSQPPPQPQHHPPPQSPHPLLLLAVLPGFGAGVPLPSLQSSASSPLHAAQPCS